MQRSPSVTHAILWSSERKPHPEVCEERAVGVRRGGAGLRPGTDHLCSVPQVGVDR